MTHFYPPLQANPIVTVNLTMRSLRMRKGEKNVVDLPAKIQRLCMDNIRPSPLWTSDYTWGPLRVFIRQIIASPLP